MPAVCDRLRTIAGVVQTGLEANDSSIQRMEGRMSALENVVSDFCNGAFNLTFTPGSHRGQEQEQLPLGSLPLPAPSPSDCWPLLEAKYLASKTPLRDAPHHNASISFMIHTRQKRSRRLRTLYMISAFALILCVKLCCGSLPSFIEF
jgi:hypothetical protein